VLSVSALLAQGPTFTPQDALRAEWARQPLTLTEAQQAALSPADRARLELSLRRIGAQGAPALLPPELDQPTEALWLRKAAAAKTPRERFDALFFLNRFKSAQALTALAGLSADDAAAWPRHLHLEAGLATARLNGADLTPALRGFLAALQKAGKVEPIRAQAARLRLVMAGKEQALLPPVPATPGSLLALLDAWNKAPWEQRREAATRDFLDLTPSSGLWARLGLQAPSPATLRAACVGILSRLAEGLPKAAPAEAFPTGGAPWPCAQDPLSLWYGFQGLAKAAVPLPALRDAVRLDPPFGVTRPDLQGALLPALRKQAPAVADALRTKLLAGSDPIARAAAIEDLPSVPADLEALTRRAWADAPLDSQQILIQSYARWQLTPADQQARLRPWLEHPDWACRLEAYRALVKLDPAAPWPGAPAPSPVDQAILAEAERLVKRGRPVRLRITFSGPRQVTLRLDPMVAPLNVANLVLLVRKGFFNGRRVPRVVPDFVVQLGSPIDTMDGGPGYTVRCEDSLTWYGPGSVGMALSGKDTGGSQVFITTNATPHLTGKYTRVGELEQPDRALPLLDALELGAQVRSIRVLP
jgi:cyclophilin family peptidyl-prolyl cis-trans isomerase